VRIYKINLTDEAAAAQIFQDGAGDVSRGLAPTTATDRGANSLSRR